MGELKQLLALLEKDILIKKFKRNPHQLAIEIFLPLIMLFSLKFDIMPATVPHGDGDEWRSEQRFKPLGPHEGKYKLGEEEQLFYVRSNNYSNAIVERAFEAHNKRNIIGLSKKSEFFELSAKNWTSEGFAIHFSGSPAATDLQYTLRFPKEPKLNDFENQTRQVVAIMIRLFREHVKYFKKRPSSGIHESLMHPFPVGAVSVPSKAAEMRERSHRVVLILISCAYVTMGLSSFFVGFCKDVIMDKESRFKELMKMMGMSDVVYWANAMCASLVTGLPLCLISSEYLSTFSFFSNSSPTVVFAVFLFLVIGTTLVVLLLTVVCYTATAGIMAFVVYLVLAQFAFDSWFGLFAPKTGTPRHLIFLSSFIPIHAFNWCLKVIFAQEADGQGSRWSNLFTTPVKNVHVSLGLLFLAQMLSWLFWICIILYIDAVNPWQYGVPKDPLFFFDYFPGCSKSVTSKVENLVPSRDESGVVEKMPPDAGSPVIRVVRVGHNFGQVKAVNDLSFDVYGRQITILLGHNGAGKTTIMNIMTGLFPPLSGDVFMNGYSITKETKKARESLGLCPQHNVLFDYLTVAEHLRFFAKLKNSKFPSIEDEINHVLRGVDLLPKKNVLSANLSGGMKRKLSLANAAIGGTEILILDEPSSGLDPKARRLVWHFLREELKDRTILMTTHHMDEADFLGDRVILLARGRLVRAGSPMFLKRIMETGYKVRLAKESPGVDSGHILSAVRKGLRQPSNRKIRIVSDIGSEVLIDIGNPTTEDIIAMFKALESDKGALEIARMGVAVTTMEDVFCKVGDIDEGAVDVVVKNSTGSQDSETRTTFENPPRFEPLTGPARLCRQFKGLYWKRFLLTKREWKFIWWLLCWLLLLSYVFTGLLEAKETSRTKKSKYSLKSLFGNTRGFLAGAQDDFISSAKDEFSKDGVEFITVTAKSDDEINEYLLKLSNESQTDYLKKWSVGLSNRTLWFNGQQEHLAGAALARWQSAALTKIIGLKSNVHVTNWPVSLRIEKYKTSIGEERSQVRDVGIIFLPTILLFLAYPAMSHSITERQTKFKLIQLMTGVNPALFHVASFCFDFALQAFLSAFLLAMLRFSNPRGCFSESADTFIALTVLLLCYIAAVTPISYLWASFSSDSVSAPWSFFKAILPLSIGIGMMAQGRETRSDIGSVRACSGNHSTYCYKYMSSFSMDPVFGAGYQMSILLFEGLICMVALIFSDFHPECAYSVVHKLKAMYRTPKYPSGSSTDEGTLDADVIEEQQVVENIVKRGETALHTLVAHRLRKHFEGVKAVKDVSFHLVGNECFGLLGTNGAGKTTVFGILTGDIPLFGGKATIRSFAISSSRREYQSQIGYCPQFDAVHASLTGSETLELFCALRAIPKTISKEFIRSMATIVDILPYVDKKIGSFSGGNKRKLSLAVAMIGRPVVLFLDEPTSGVDPSARRKIYTSLSQAQKERNTAIVLTSHSMEVCEALCSRVAIMMKGTFRCLGSTQHLKSKFGSGYTVQIKLKDILQTTKDDLRKAMSKLFGRKCKLEREHMRLFRFHVSDVSLKWSELFQKVQELRRNSAFDFEDIIVSDKTLDDLFQSFGAAQADMAAASSSSTL